LRLEFLSLLAAKHQLKGGFIHIRNAFFFLLCLISASASAQFKVRGTVYDSSRVYVMPGVSVLSTSGRGTSTDGNGSYEIDVNEKDSIWFSYLGKPTRKYPVLTMNDPLHFDISIQLNIAILKEVRVLPRNYRQDSIQNRLDYAKGFNFEKPKLKPTLGGGPGGVGVGFDLDEIIRMFQFRRNKMMAKFQERLLEQEKDKSIDHRFSKALVFKLTGLNGDERDSFMAAYRPSFEFAERASDYEFQLYIKKCFRLWRQTHPANKSEEPKTF
jgi:hypothetical protein